jgi:hypothetical protein
MCSSPKYGTSNDVILVRFANRSAGGGGVADFASTFAGAAELADRELFDDKAPAVSTPTTASETRTAIAAIHVRACPDFKAATSLPPLS